MQEKDLGYVAYSTETASSNHLKTDPVMEARYAVYEKTVQVSDNSQ